MSIPEDPDGRVGFDAGDQRDGAALRHVALLQLVREKGHDVRPNASVHYEAALAAHRALFFFLVPSRSCDRGGEKTKIVKNKKVKK